MGAWTMTCEACGVVFTDGIGAGHHEMSSGHRVGHTGAENQSVKGYGEGVVYGRKVAQGMSAGRRWDNDRYVRHAVYALAGSPTRAFWLGFRRAMRGSA